MYGSNNMKKSVVFNNQFTPKLGGQFELESGGQFAPELVVNLHWKVVVNLTGFSSRKPLENKHTRHHYCRNRGRHFMGCCGNDSVYSVHQYRKVDCGPYTKLKDVIRFTRRWRTKEN